MMAGGIIVGVFLINGIIFFSLLILCLHVSFLSHRRIAPAVIFSNGSPNGHPLACLTILFTYTYSQKKHGRTR